MESKKKGRKVDITLLILGTLVFIAIVVAFWKGGWQLPTSGLIKAGQLMRSVWLRLLLGIALGGLIQVLIPAPLVVKWMGPTSGLKGILIGSYLGIVMIGGPYVIFPIIASLYRAGAGVGPVISLIVGWSLIPLDMPLVWQFPFLGVGIPLARYIVCLIITPLAGLAGGALFKILTGRSKA